MKMDSKVWSTEDGHRFTSIPTDVPTKWTPVERSRNPFESTLCYVSGPYEIVRRPYGRSSFTYQVKRDGVELFGFYARLKDAKAHAEKNARGEEIVNVA